VNLNEAAVYALKGFVFTKFNCWFEKELCGY